MAQFGEWLSDVCLMADILVLEFSQSSLAHIGGLKLLMNMTSLFTDMAENSLRIQNLIKLKVIHIGLKYLDLGIFPCVCVYIYIIYEHIFIN